MNPFARFIVALMFFFLCLSAFIYMVVHNHKLTEARIEKTQYVSDVHLNYGEDDVEWTNPDGTLRCHGKWFNDQALIVQYCQNIVHNEKPEG